MLKKLALVFFIALFSAQVQGLERPDKEFKIFQFPPNMIPRIDGNTDDWAIVPDNYAVGTDELKDTVKNTPLNKKDLDISVKIGWVKGMNQLYFLYEAYDDYWEFEKPGSLNDIFEVVVDGDLSGGPFINDHRKDKLDWPDSYFRFQGVHAQNYHINTPALGKSWTMVWGCQPWIAHLPWANAVYKYDFKQGQSGKLVLEFWITPFDYAPYDGPGSAIVSRLEENKIIGISWSILDQDGHEGGYDGFYNISHKTEMCVNASDFVAFRLMPLEKRFHKPIEADFTFTVVDMDRRLIAFKDLSYGEITSWNWEFGDGETSTEQNPIHQYKKQGNYYVVNLTVEGPDGKARLSIPWDVAIK